MPFISKDLSVYFPFNQFEPVEDNKTHWPDESGYGLSATAENCASSTLALLGSCLQINPGGQLTVTDPNQQIRAQLTGDKNQLTLEFWAEPDTEAMKKPQEYTLLQGPITIRMQGNKLHWFVGQGSTLTGYAIQEVEGLHHWAIVVNKTVNSAQITFFKDSVEVTNQAQSIPIPDGLNTATAATDLVIGARENGWTGKLAHLRMWTTALTTNQLQQNRQRDITAHAAFKATTAIRWQLVNANNEPALYIHSNGPQELRLELENVTESTTLVIPQSTGTASFAHNHYHFCVVFRPGTIALPLLESDIKKFIQAIGDKNPGWSISLDKWEVQDCICFLRTDPSVELTSSNRSLTLFLPGVAAEPGSGSRPTTVGLQYKGLTASLDPSQSLDGQRAQPLSILYREPSIRKPPLEVGIVGAPVVLNNGTDTCLSLYIKNLNRDASQVAALLVLGDVNTDVNKQPKFTLKIDTLPDAKGLGDVDDLMNTVANLSHRQLSVSSPQDSGGIVSWEISPKQPTGENGKVSLNPNETILLSLSNLKTTAPPGRSVLRLCYEDFDRYGEGEFEIPIDRVSAIPAKLTQAGGAGYGLAIGHDPRNPKPDSTNWETDRDPNREALKEMLSIKKEKGNGDVVRIENSSDGIGLNIVQNSNSNGLAAKFSGGTGVEINGKLDAKHDVHIDGHLQVGERGSTNANNGNLVAKLHVVSENRNTSGSNQPTTTTSINQNLSLHLRVDSLPIQDRSSFQRSPSVVGNLQIIADSQLGNCLHFSGNEKITCNTIDLSGSFTIQFWVKVTQTERGTAEYGFIVGQEEVGTTTNRTSKSLHIGFRYLTNKFAFAFYGNDTDVSIQLDEQWHYWSCVYDRANNNRHVYRDGIRIGGSENVAPYSGSGPLVIGKVLENHAPPPASYKGGLADIRVHTRALSEGEILLCMRAILIPTAHIENTDLASGLLVEQYSNGLAALFKGGNGVEITGNLQVGQRIRDKTGVIMPVGAVLPFAGAVAPEGWLLCNGQQVIGEQYQDLAKVLFSEDRFVFNVPDYQEKFIAGAAGTGDYKLGNTGGQASVTLTVDQMPSHTHSINDPGHKHSYQKTDAGDKKSGDFGGSSMQSLSFSNPSTDSSKTNISIQSAGNSRPHENRPPFVALNYIIKY